MLALFLSIKTKKLNLVASKSPLLLSSVRNTADAPTAAPPPSKARPAGSKTSRAKQTVPPASAAAAAATTPRKSASAATAAATPTSSKKKTTPFLPLFLLLAAARLFSALTNIVHDCDEVFNYWEPLHFALFGSGMQTWEYSSKFALRPWLYLWLHGAVAAPAAALSRALFPGLVGFGLSKKVAFFAVRAALALASAAAEASLAAAAGDVLGGGGSAGGAATKKKTRSSDGGGGSAAATAANTSPLRRLPAVSLILAALLASSAGMFSAAPALLPSSFVMVFLTAAAAGVLRGERESPLAVVAAGVVGLLWGWPVASVAFFPYALWVLVASWKEGNFLKTAAAAAALTALALAPLVLLDRLAYGKWTLSLLNFLRYNVSGDGGDSSLYGVEEWHYYLRNALLNLGLAVPLAAAAPAVLGVVFAATRAGLISPPPAAPSSSVSVSPRALQRLALALLPLPLWSLTISALPHKEERFLYPVYPLACLAAAAAVAAAPAAVAAVFGAASAALLPRQRRRSSARRGSASFYSLFSLALQASLVALAALVGASRVAALLASYSAPLRIYSSLPADPPAPAQNRSSLVCLGAEWHRFPSSFLLPGEAYRLAFVAAGFGGLLPVPFDASQGGSRAAPDSLNDRNARDERNELADDAACDYFVGLAPPLGDAPRAATAGEREEGKEGKEGGGDWAERAALPFLDVNAAAVRALPAPARAFYLPRWLAAGVFRRPSWAAEEGSLRERGRYVLMERLRR